MKTYYFTFGQKYRHEQHPAGGHPDGWFEIVATDEDAARETMFSLCGPQWAMCYTLEEFDSTFYNLGCLFRFTQHTAENS